MQMPIKELVCITLWDHSMILYQHLNSSLKVNFFDCHKVLLHWVQHQVDKSVVFLRPNAAKEEFNCRKRYLQNVSKRKSYGMKLSSSLLWSLKFFQNLSRLSLKGGCWGQKRSTRDQINLQKQKPSKKGLPLTLWPLRVTNI